MVERRGVKERKIESYCGSLCDCESYTVVGVKMNILKFYVFAILTCLHDFKIDMWR